MPDGGSALVNRCGCEGFTVEDELSHVLPRYVEQLGHIRQADQVRRRLDERRIWNRSLDVRDAAEHRLRGGLSLAYEAQGDAPSLTDTERRIFTTGIAKPLDQVVDVNARRSKRECQVNSYSFTTQSSCSSSVSPARRRQPSTTRLICRAWFSGLLGVRAQYRQD